MSGDARQSLCLHPSRVTFWTYSGFVAERVDLRYFLSGGMVLSGLLTMALGFAYFLEIHSLGYFIFIQVNQDLTYC